MGTETKAIDAQIAAFRQAEIATETAARYRRRAFAMLELLRRERARTEEIRESDEGFSKYVADCLSDAQHALRLPAAVTLQQLATAIAAALVCECGLRRGQGKCDRCDKE